MLARENKENRPFLSEEALIAQIIDIHTPYSILHIKS